MVFRAELQPSPLTWTHSSTCRSSHSRDCLLGSSVCPPVGQFQIPGVDLLLHGLVQPGAHDRDTETVRPTPVVYIRATAQCACFALCCRVGIDNMASTRTRYHMFLRREASGALTRAFIGPHGCMSTRRRRGPHRDLSFCNYCSASASDGRWEKRTTSMSHVLWGPGAHSIHGESSSIT